MMINKKNFYFLRHGETELNSKNVIYDETDVPLNEMGRIQANLIKPIITQLPIRTICVSPLRRARETAEIAAGHLSCEVIVVDELRECNGHEWVNMIESKPCENVQAFMQRVVIGVNYALSYQGPVLIVAHGGVHWALCHQINIQGHQKRIGNCIPVNFYVSEQNEWKANSLLYSNN